jgi:biofilm PGA synthesis lipoprotein PgaB
VSGYLRILVLMLLVPMASAFAADDGPIDSSPIDGYRVVHPLHDQLTILAYHDVREDIKRDYAADPYAISAQNMAMQFAWLRDNGYRIVALDQVLAALDGGRSLPDKAVLLTFDDGLASVYSSAFPLLKLFNYPALVSVVTAWVETTVEVQYENHLLSSRDFLTWAQMREMQDSGLIEIASHTHDLHLGIEGNPQKNVQPAAVTRLYTDRYETGNEYLQRIEADLATSAALIKQKTGRPARVIVWPYGQYNSDLRNIAALHGMKLSLSLDPGDTRTQGYPVLGRELIAENPGVYHFAPIFTDPVRPGVLRAAQVDLDYVYDPDPVQQEANLSVLLDRIKALGISHVFLQAFADPDADGAAEALYFPNRHMPMRADLFNRVSWQLQTRCNVKVFAWMPLLGYAGDSIPPEWRLLQDAAGAGELQPDPAGEPRLSPYVPEARRFIKDIYADLAAYTNFAGIHFHDDGRLNESEDANPAAIAAYRAKFGDEFSIAAAADDPELMVDWAAFKSATLAEFSLELRDAVAYYRPVLRTSRNIFASALLESDGTIYLAQDFDEYLATYDYVTIMAMPLLEGVPSERQFYNSLVKEVKKRPDALYRTVFQLQTVDWRDGSDPLSSAKLRKRMRKLQSQGVRNLAYYPDDFLKDHPSLDELVRGISLTDHPVPQ